MSTLHDSIEEIKESGQLGQNLKKQRVVEETGIDKILQAAIYITCP